MQYVAIPTDVVRTLQAGGPDANGQVPERKLSDGGGNPCRHCLQMIPEGAEMLVLAHRPFPVPQPYAEIGPIFLCADACEAGGGEGLPEILASPDYIVRGYGSDDRIVYGSGGVIATEGIPARAEALFANPAIRYLHVRSARNNCYQLRIDRG
jgi:hypothetical protein